MKLLAFFALTAIGSCAAGNSSAQLPNNMTVVGAKPDTTLRNGRFPGNLTGAIPADTFIDRFKKNLQPNRMPGYNMPNAFRMQLPADVYEGNNGKGQDIYRSQLDNMAILKPDSSSPGYMPNAIMPPPKRPSITDENGEVQWRRIPGPKSNMPNLQVVPRRQPPVVPKK